MQKKTGSHHEKRDVLSSMYGSVEKVGRIAECVQFCFNSSFIRVSVVAFIFCEFADYRR